jgi:RHS repeat-associated protein
MRFSRFSLPMSSPVMKTKWRGRVRKEAWQPRTGGRFGEKKSDQSQKKEDVDLFSAPSGAVAAAPGVGELPWFSFHDFPLAVDTLARVNLANGNLLVTANDATIPAPGYALRADRFYNGLSPDLGVFGGGWKSSMGAFDVGLDNGGTYVDFWAPNGHIARFTTTNGTTYSSPAGLNATLKKVANFGDSAFVLTYNRTGEQLIFSGTGFLTQSLDRNGIGELYNYSAGRMVAAYHTNGRGLTFNFDYETGVFVSMEDTAGRLTTFSYGDNGLESVSAPDGASSQYTYDASGRLSAITVNSAAATTVTTVFNYDTQHRISKVTEKSTSTTWGAKPDTATTFTYASGLTTVTDANGKTSKYAHDTKGRITSTTDALNRKRSQTWTANSDIASATDALGTGTNLNTTTYSYDGSNNVSGAQLPTGAAASAAYATGTSCSAPPTGTSFQVKCSTDPAGNKKSYEYDAAGNLTKQKDATTASGAIEFQKTYNSASSNVCGGFAGQVCTTKDGKGNVTSYLYDGEGDLIKVTPPVPLGVTTYTHDSLGRVMSVKNGNSHTTKFTYDVRDRLLTTIYNNNQRITTTYYDNGLERTVTDSAGGTKTLEYDAQGRLTKQTGPGAGITQKYAYDKVGNMLTYEDGAGVVSHVYDSANQLTAVREPGGTCPATGNPAASSGCTVFTYDANGAETRRLFPGGAKSEIARDKSGRPTRITAKDAAGAVAVDIGYGYTAPGTTSDRGTIQTRTSFKEQGVTPGAITTYTYDSLTRVTRAEEKLGATVSATWAYTYDAAGNRTGQTRAGSTGASAGVTSYTYNAANQLASSVTGTTTKSWAYDAAGNETLSGTTGNTSTFGDRLQATKVGGTTSGYFGGGNAERVAAGVATSTSSILGLATRTVGNSMTAFTRSSDGTVISSRDTGSHYFVFDALGSTVGLFAQTGVFEGGYSYSPYGETRATATAASVVGNILRYIGGELDSSGSYKLGARYYDTASGRFTQMDPSGQETHPYAYAGCNPVNAKDPTGLITQKCAWAINWAVFSIYGVNQSVILGLGGSAASGGTATPYAVAMAVLSFGSFIASLSAVKDECE